MLQAYPDGPLKLVVPFAPGGGSDTFARTLFRKSSETKKLSPVPLVIVNVPGAGGTIGSRQVRDGKGRDGQTLLLLHDGLFTAKYSGKVSLRTRRGLRTRSSHGSWGRGTRGKVRILDFQIFHSHGEAASNPDSITYSTNLGAPSHFAGP